MKLQVLYRKLSHSKAMLWKKFWTSEQEIGKISISLTIALNIHGNNKNPGNFKEQTEEKIKSLFLKQKRRNE